MTNATDKLIADNLWWCIDPIINSVGHEVILAQDQLNNCAPVMLHQHPASDEWHEWITDTWVDVETYTHFRPLPDDRCANALRVAVEALLSIAYRPLGGDTETYMCGVHIQNDAKKYLAEINRIADEK